MTEDVKGFLKITGMTIAGVLFVAALVVAVRKPAEKPIDCASASMNVLKEFITLVTIEKPDADGKAKIRIGSTTNPPTMEEFRQLIVKMNVIVKECEAQEKK